MKAAAPLQKKSGTAAALTITGKATQNPLQLKTASTQQNPLQLKKGDTTGLPNDLKVNVEALSGYSMDDVQVHYNSDKPAQLQALAYAQGTDIHIASGQEKHLPHEAWHVVQQKQGRVRPTMQMKGEAAVNDDKGLEKEADKMGTKSLHFKQLNPLLQTNAITQNITAYENGPSSVISSSQKLSAHIGRNSVLQMKGVGGNKIGFTRTNNNNKAAWEKLQKSWEEAKKTRKDAKDRIERTLPDKAGKGGFTKYYADELDKIKDERELLEDILNKDGADPVVKIKDNKVVVVIKQGEKTDTEEVIGELINNNDRLYAKKNLADAGTRDVYSKKNDLLESSKSDAKEYIKDYRGVFTRRYAYHEMNYHQMMDFIMSGELTGRYQMFMSAGEAANTSPQKIEHPKNKEAVSKRRDVKTSDLTWEEVAVLHQWKGSGPYQSGVSLTSTSREEVRSNKGDQFKSKGGFRIKIDLSKVALETPIINDYAADSISQKPTSTTNRRPDRYEFPESATKNRELYIERVKKEWVTSIEYHGTTEVTTTFSAIEKAILGATGVDKEVTGIGSQAYLAGFLEGMKGKDYTGIEASGKLGADAGKNALAGYNRGVAQRNLKGGTVATPQVALKEQATYEQGKIPPEHKYDAHKVGQMWGRCTTKPMFTSIAEYGAAIKGRNKI